jgi:hypothetical protein
MHQRLETLRKKVAAEADPKKRIALFAKGLGREFRAVSADPKEIKAMGDDIEREANTKAFVEAIYVGPAEADQNQSASA